MRWEKPHGFPDHPQRKGPPGRHEEAAACGVELLWELVAESCFCTSLLPQCKQTTSC